MFLRKRFLKEPFKGSGDYWERRYQAAGHSGSGSYGQLAEFKAEVLNGFVREHGIETVMEHGCGDGNQLQLADYPAYVGYDVSRTALGHCRKLFASDSSKEFRHVDDYDGAQADLALSLDVIYHLVEDETFDAHMKRLFESARRFAIIYSSDIDEPYREGSHVRNRAFTKWIEENRPPFTLERHIPNRYPFDGEVKTGSMSDFFIYRRIADGTPVPGEAD
ncbi:MAG: class I SAM-dependent methyltransferase [Akkermansiaceae bacterium]|nr:class I SAM-dependent methyltransferase [Akkermansiaceae bacterium]NNM29425.1 class I SAM-dependent methyltransferase [Akkermansiaceae bacterium]